MSACNENYWDCTGARLVCALAKSCKPCVKPCKKMFKRDLLNRGLLVARADGSHKAGWVIFALFLVISIMSIATFVMVVKMWKVVRKSGRHNRTAEVLANRGEEGIELPQRK